MQDLTEDVPYLFLIYPFMQIAQSKDVVNLQGAEDRISPEKRKLVGMFRAKVSSI